jgi:hypothetical protein|uniref:Uncharacterized protein n=1 Tax=viral metagenome TaxID=1070528 RepID=A0A6C0AL95_9ZZZZ
MQYVTTFDNQISSLMNQYVKKPTIIRGIVHLLLILYVARLAPSLPRQVLILFENQYFKLFIFSLVLWTAQFSPSTSILIALAFMVTVNYSTNKALWEFLENVESAAPMAESAAPMIIESTTLAPAPMETQAPVIIETTTPVPVIAAVTEVPKSVVSEPAECYPIRRYDMSKVGPSSGDSAQQEFSK